MTLKNTGSADATIDNVIINGKPYGSWPGGITVKIGGTAFNPGNRLCFKIRINKDMINYIPSANRFQKWTNIRYKNTYSCWT